MVTELDVRDYVASCAEQIIEDDFNEDGNWTEEEFKELQDRAYALLSELRYGDAIDDAD